MRHFDERHAKLRELTCERCGAEVTVTKFSPQHTSVQWTSDAARTCAEFAEAEARAEAKARAEAEAQAEGGAGGEAGAAARGPGGRRVRVRGCASLWRS